MDHHSLVTASVKHRDQFPKVSRRHIDNMENIYGSNLGLELNLGEFLANNRVFNTGKTLSLKIIKKY